MSRTARQHTKPHKQKGRRRPTEGLGELPQAEPMGGRSLQGFRPPPRPEAIGRHQANYMQAIVSQDIVFGVGPAGCGKTFLPAAMAAFGLRERHIEKIILTRPAVEAGERLGFLPGEMQEKYEPYLRPFRDVFTKFLGRGHLEYAIKSGQIEPLPLAFMRGMTFPEGTWVLLDEAQNVTPTQMKMFLTRAGEGAKLIITGDPTQKDIPGPSGLVDAMRRVGSVPGVDILRFDRGDVVRSGIVQRILERYEEPEEPEPAAAGLAMTLARGRALA